jgi:hypothetical protein
MSALGHERTLQIAQGMSALPPKADIYDRLTLRFIVSAVSRFIVSI